MSAEAKTWKCGSLVYTKRGLIALFGWLLWGDVCFTLMEAVVPSILPLHFKNLGASNMTIGFVLTTLPGIFNLTVTPWLSFKSDRHRSRCRRGPQVRPAQADRQPHDSNGRELRDSDGGNLKRRGRGTLAVSAIAAGRQQAAVVRFRRGL